MTLAGTPVLDLTNGPTSLAIVGGTSLVTASTPFTFDLNGLAELLLATQAGSITIGQGATFTGVSTRLDFYARGATSDLNSLYTA